MNSTYLCPPPPHQLNQAQLRSLRRSIDLANASPEFLQFAFEHHKLTVLGLEHLPRHGAVIFACNHTGTPVLAGASLMLETVLLVTHALNAYRQRAPRPLMGSDYYTDPSIFRLHQPLLEQLGCVPDTVDNGIKLLDMGDDVLIYPEGKDSIPPYQTRPFSQGFAKMAWIAEVPIVPVALIGPHESRLRINVPDGPIIFLTPNRNPNPVAYKLTFLPPVHIRTAIRSLQDPVQLSGFCEQVRQRIQTNLDINSVNRPLIAVARSLQQRYGHPQTLWGKDGNSDYANG